MLKLYLKQNSTDISHESAAVVQQVLTLLAKNTLNWSLKLATIFLMTECTVKGHNIFPEFSIPQQFKKKNVELCQFLHSITRRLIHGRTVLLVANFSVFAWDLTNCQPHVFQAVT